MSAYQVFIILCYKPLSNKVLTTAILSWRSKGTAKLVFLFWCWYDPKGSLPLGMLHYPTRFSKLQRERRIRWDWWTQDVYLNFLHLFSLRFSQGDSRYHWPWDCHHRCRSNLRCLRLWPTDLAGIYAISNKGMECIMFLLPSIKIW